MLRGKHNWIVSVRRPDETIVVHERPLRSWLKRYRLARVPLLRGFIGLIESLILGVKAISLSAQEAADEEEEELGAKEIAVAILFAIALAVALFIALPAAFASALYRVFESVLVINFLEGLAKITVFVLYIWSISRLRDIARVFEYHGAEHKVIHAYEAGDELTVDAAQTHSPLHVRCGTSFLLLVMVLSILVFSLLGRPPLLERIAYHIAIIPLIAGLAYEIIKLAGRRRTSLVLRWIMAPGLALQRMTTREPSPDQLEVAHAALERLLVLEQGKEPKRASAAPATAVAASSPSGEG